MGNVSKSVEHIEWERFATAAKPVLMLSRHRLVALKKRSHAYLPDR